MNIFELTGHYPPSVGGVETHLGDLTKELSKKHKIIVLAYRPIMNKVGWKIYESEKNLKIMRIPWYPGLFYKLVDKPILEFLYLLPGLFFVTPFVLMANKINVIHAHGLIAGFVGVFWAKIFNKRVVVTTHSEYEFPKKGLYRIFAGFIFNTADQVLTLSEKSKIEVVSLGVPDEKVNVFTYWVDLEKFKPNKKSREQLGWQNEFIVLFAGRLVSEKGIKVLIESAKIWNKKIKLKIIGAGPLDDLCSKAMEDFANIEYLGTVNYSDMPKYYCAADIVIVPSIHEEGFGRVILEALACGTAVIASNRGGIKEAMDNNVGSLIEINKQNIKSEVEKYYKNKKILMQKSDRTRIYAEKKYSSKNVGLILKALRDEK